VDDVRATTRLTLDSLAQLVEQKKIALEDPINRHLPPELQIPEEGFHSPIRIRRALSPVPEGVSHTSLLCGSAKSTVWPRLTTAHRHLNVRRAAGVSIHSHSNTRGIKYEKR
jgi:hypothetical protein